MGRRKQLLKQENMEKANRLLEARVRRSLMTEKQKGDSNNDGTVNQDDVDWVQDNWGKEGDVYDSNDGIVNLEDLTLTVNNMGQGTATPPAPTKPAPTPPIACDPPQGGCKPGYVWMPWNADGTGCTCQSDGTTVGSTPPEPEPCVPPSDGCPDGTSWNEETCSCEPDDIDPTNECDMSWASPCAQQHFGSLGGAQSLQTWLGKRQQGWDSVGCQHLQNVVNWTTSQLNSGVTGPNAPNAGDHLSQTQITRKTAKREWAQCQAAECDCPPLNLPPLIPSDVGAGGNTPPPSAPPSDTEKPPSDKMPVKTPKGKKGQDVEDKKEDKELKEQINKMKSLWNYNK